MTLGGEVSKNKQMDSSIWETLPSPPLLQEPPHRAAAAKLALQAATVRPVGEREGAAGPMADRRTQAGGGMP